MSDDYEDVSIGGVTWHSSDEDSGPDVGISVYVGENDRVWCGEISRKCFSECEGEKHFSDDGGWFIVRYNPHPTLIARCADPDDAREFVESVAAWIRAGAVKQQAPG